MAHQNIKWSFQLASFAIILVLVTLIKDVESADFYGAFADNRILSPNFKHISGPLVTKLDCAQLCAGTVDCDAYNFIPPPVIGANAVCQFVTIGFNTSAVNGGPGAEVWISKTSTSDFVRARLLSDRKVYMVINQQVQPYTAADTHCARMGGRVAGPTSIDKFNDFVEALNGKKRAYMGMKDSAIQGLFLDEKGNTYPWSLNFPGEPGYQGPQEDCLQTWDTVPNGLVGWMIGDNMCNVTGPYICEFPRSLNVKDIGCFEIPPKPEGAVYQNWDGVSLPLPVGAFVNSVCKPGRKFHTGISVYAVTCGADGYWTRPGGLVPFCSGTPGYVQSNTSTACYKLLKETIVFPSSAEAHCQRYGGRVLPFTYGALTIFQEAFFSLSSSVTGYMDGMVFAGYNDVMMEGSFVDSLGNPIPPSWGTGEPNGGMSQNYAILWLDNNGYYSLFDEKDANYASVVCQFSSC